MGTERAQPDYVNLGEVPAIKQSRGKRFTARDQIKEYVEAPLLRACEILYDKNIQTTESSANFEHLNYKHSVVIVINYDTLSEENKEIADRLCSVRHNSDGYMSALIEIPLTNDVKLIELSAIGAANQFKDQPLLWSKPRTIQEMRKLYSIDPDDENFKPEDFVGEEYPFYYDSDSKLFYDSKEIFDKSKSSGKTS